MKAWSVKKFGEKISMTQTAIPKPKASEVIVEIKYCGLCHTDAHAIRGDWSVPPVLPLCPGHEGVGFIKELGEDVHDFFVGECVGVPWLYSSCGKCEQCLSGWETLCPEQQNSGYSVDGCFRQFTNVPADHVVRIPMEIPPMEAARVTSYKALKETDAKPGQWVSIIGAAGGLGHLAVQFSKAMGFRTIAVDLGAAKIEYCRSLGAEHVLDVGDTIPVVDQIREITQGGAHGVVVVATHPSAYQIALDACRVRGTVVCVSVPKDCSLQLDLLKVVFRRITLRGSVVGTRQDMIETFEFAKRALVKCHIRLEPLERVNEAIADVVNNQVMGRVVLRVS